VRIRQADQAAGCIEGRFQGEHERHSRAAAKGKEEGCKGRLIGFNADTIDSATDAAFCR
jgi:hypothetical protein